MTTPVQDDDAAPAVRQAERGDLVAIHRIERASFPQPWPYAAFERYLDEPGFLVAERSVGHSPAAADEEAEAELLGYVVADAVPHRGAPLGHVKDIAVAPDERGAGIGSTLLDRAIAILADRGVDSVKLEVRADNEGAQSLYRDRGFEHRRTIAEYYGNDEDALVMVRSLD